MSVKLFELELRPCALVDGVAFVWSGDGWRSPAVPPGANASPFSLKLAAEGVRLSDAAFAGMFPEADLASLPASSNGVTARTVA